MEESKAEAPKDAVLEVAIAGNKLAAYVSVSSFVTKIDPEAVYQALAAAGVVYGLKPEAIASFSASPQEEPFLIAEGVPPQPGKDENVELLFLNVAVPEEEPGTQRINFRETSTIVSVEAGAVLAVKHPAVPGSEGKGVTGEPLPPPSPKTIELRAGKGVEIQEEGTKAVALVNGRPWAKETATICTVSVDPLLIHKEDVSIKSGNIRFKGDVKILGNVFEAMEVFATGNVEVMGLVTRAAVQSGGKLVVHRGVINSSLKAGRHFPGAKKIAFLLQDLKANLDLLDKALAQLKDRKDFEIRDADFGRLVIALLDTRFKDIRSLVKNTIRQIASLRNQNLPEEIIKLTKSLSCLAGLNPLTVNNFNELLANVSAAAEALQQQESSRAEIRVHSAIMSNIQSSGNVLVLSQGCISTVINAGGNVVVKGAFKGGEIFCEGNAEIQELGSNLGAPPVVRVSSRSFIKVGKAYPGAIIQVGQRRLVLSQQMGSFKARLNREGELDII
ncbi:MAG: FapA family protein [Bacillota bacterium]